MWEGGWSYYNKLRYIIDNICVCVAPVYVDMILYPIRVGWWISEYFACCAKWKLLGIETAVVKGFFSKINILEDKF